MKIVVWIFRQSEQGAFSSKQRNIKNLVMSSLRKKIPPKPCGTPTRSGNGTFRGKEKRTSRGFLAEKFLEFLCRTQKTDSDNLLGDLPKTIGNKNTHQKKTYVFKIGMVSNLLDLDIFGRDFQAFHRILTNLTTTFLLKTTPVLWIPFGFWVVLTSIVGKLRCFWFFHEQGKSWDAFYPMAHRNFTVLFWRMKLMDIKSISISKPNTKETKPFANSSYMISLVRSHGVFPGMWFFDTYFGWTSLSFLVLKSVFRPWT